MSVYEKQVWIDGVTPVDAEHLNYMESGIAANAEAADNISAEIGAYEKLKYNWEQGTVAGGSGEIFPNDTRVRTTEIHLRQGEYIKIEPNGQKYNVNKWVDNVFQGSFGEWQTTTQTFIPEVDTTYRITAAKLDDSQITPSAALVAIELPVRASGLEGRIGTIEEAVGTFDELTYNWEQGSVINGTGEMTAIATRVRTTEIHLRQGEHIKIEPNGQKYNVNRWVDGVFQGSFWEWQTTTQTFFADVDTTYRITAAKLDDSQITPSAALVTIELPTRATGLEGRVGVIEDHISIKPNLANTGNCSIVCAKEHTYNDGTAPMIEYFLLEEVGTKRFFISHDMKDKKFAFFFNGDPSIYTFGILQNGDIIAVRFAETLVGNLKDDSNRVNPYVFLAREGWSVQHEVDFGDALKPCGWLSNCGFRVLPDGTCLFCEYTRQTTATANVWRLTGDLTNSANWVPVKSFPITTTDNLTGFKHIHTVQYDHYSGVVYFATGDDNFGSLVFYSVDAGLSWKQLIPPGSSGEMNEYGWYEGSEKYCRLLNFTFTENYIYWATDSPTWNIHYLFRAERDENGILDYGTVEDYVHLPLEATYGTAYLEEYNAIFLFSRADGNVDSITVDVVDLSDGSIKTVHTLYAANENNRLLGFRTRFSEWYPHDGLVRVGFCLYATGISNATNQNKGFGNKGERNLPSDNVNNLWMQFRKTDGEFGVRFGTYYI